MNTSSALHRLVGRLRLRAESVRADRPSDAELLERFRQGGDADAFDTIVRRYGGCVLAACRKVLVSEADAEDAFQATFLVLLRSARAIRRGQALGGWLRGVAHRIALHARRRTARRACLESGVSPRAAEETPDLSWREACAILHEELDRLPDTYRLPLLLCYLEGKSRDEAAREIGCKADVLRGRLERGRDRLRHRLTRRGVSLSAGLLASVAAPPTADVPPEGLLRATLEAATTGQVPASVSALLRGVAPPVGSGTFKLLGVALLAVALISGDAGLRTHGAPPAPAAPAAATQPVAAAAEKEKEVVEVSGRVLGPDGKPIPGARLYLLGTKRTKPEPIATADADGAFRFTAKQADVGFNGRVLAAADGLAPDWLDLGRCGKGEVTLRLREDVAFTGRIVTLEGKPVVGAVVEAERIGRQADGDLTAWIDNNVKLRKESYWVNEEGLLTAEPAAFGPRLTAVTDRDGRFRLAGAGRDRVLSIRVRGDGVEHKFFWGVTRPDAPKEGYIRTGEVSYGLYGPEMTVLVGPSKPFTGTVRDRATGKGVAGVKVEADEGVSHAVSDADGRYRLEGVPKKDHYHLRASGARGVPYFNSHREDVKDTAGFAPVEVDFTLERGIEISGRVLDRDTGLPVAGEVHWDATRTNPHLKDHPPDSVHGTWRRIAPDGTYTVLAIPGPGAVAVCADARDRYPARDARGELLQLRLRSFPADTVQAIVPVDLDPEKPASLVCDVELRAGKSRRGTVLGPDGAPAAGVKVVGLVPGDARPGPTKAPDFTLSGLGDRPRVVVFLDREKKLGAVAVADGKSAEPVTVRLQPLGTVEGRVVDGDGKPWPGLKVKVLPEAPDEKYDNLPDEIHEFQGTYGIRPGLWSDFTGRGAVTDKDGRFRLEGVLPGVRFVLYVSDGDLREERTLVAQREHVRVEPGKTADLGTLKKGEGVREE
jgi:RNA polymerase sigma factor (sigma-70 family)